MTAHSRRALVVDDQAIERLLLRRSLEGLGWTVNEAADGENGWHMFRQQRYDLIVVDIFMPVQDGLEMIRQVRKRDAAAAVIAISGGGTMGFDGYLDMALRLGADVILRKPLERKEFLRTVATLLKAANPHRPQPGAERAPA